MFHLQEIKFIYIVADSYTMDNEGSTKLRKKLFHKKQFSRRNSLFNPITFKTSKNAKRPTSCESNIELRGSSASALPQNKEFGLSVTHKPETNLKLSLDNECSSDFKVKLKKICDCIQSLKNLQSE